MEIANQWAGATNLKAQVRPAMSSDKRDIVRLMRMSDYTHIHLDWRPPIDWLERGGFVVFAPSAPAQDSLAGKLFGNQPEVRACLAVGADPPPAAWVRVVCLQRNGRSEQVLAAMLAELEGTLRDTAVTQLGWLTMQPWPNKWLPELGFARPYEIETYYKENLQIPTHKTLPDLTIRQVEPDDMEQLAAIESLAFEPLWRHSAEGLLFASRQAFSFDVAEWNGRIVGFQLSSRSGENAHLARMTVLPEVQGQGVGSVLLAHALQAFQQHDIRYVSLNTQTDNYPSQALYKKFGFYATGQRLPVWVKSLE
ncbi:MAG: GNAT family N-acetyltransferase [Anaerolineales bacterium]|nr:GNAT family N-acetyltransferase [Anaerolineales bacterium]MCB8968622.1 GNAT family N-acetyltransferase [Ardenticatenaceae bacterium]